MKEISNHFALIEHDGIKDSLLLGLKPFIPDDSDEFICTSKVMFNQQPKQESSRIWDQTFQAVTTDPRISDYDGKRFAVGIIMSDGSCVVMGSADQVPVINVIPHGSAWAVSAKFSSSTRAEW